MHILLITYQLKAAKNYYQNFFSTLKSSKSWWHYLDSTWLIYTDKTPSELSDSLKNFIYKGDRFFVVEITNSQRQGWLPQEAWDWLKKVQAKINTNE